MMTVATGLAAPLMLMLLSIPPSCAKQDPAGRRASADLPARPTPVRTPVQQAAQATASDRDVLRLVRWGGYPLISRTYIVDLYRNGDVRYEGRQGVGVLGRREARAEPANIAALMAEFERLGFRDQDRTPRCAPWKRSDGRWAVFRMFDSDSAQVSVDRRGRTVTVYDDAFPKECPQPKPRDFQALGAFEDQIDAVAGTARWTSCDAGGDCPK